jgi:hypothetical protein
MKVQRASGGASLIFIALLFFYPRYNAGVLDQRHAPATLRDPVDITQEIFSGILSKK